MSQNSEAFGRCHHELLTTLVQSATVIRCVVIIIEKKYFLLWRDVTRHEMTHVARPWPVVIGCMGRQSSHRLVVTFEHTNFALQCTKN